MGKIEIIAQLPHLSREDRAEIQAKLDELAGSSWEDCAEIDGADKAALDAAVAAFEKNPDSGRSWDEVKAEIRVRLNS